MKKKTKIFGEKYVLKMLDHNRTYYKIYALFSLT